jgi:Mg2+/Co2+ transporter CorC
LSNEPLPGFNDQNQGSTMEKTKNKASLPSTLLSNSLIQSPRIKSDIIQVVSSEKTSIIDLNEDEKEQNLSIHSFPDQEHQDIMVNPNTTTIHKNQSVNSTG